MSATNTESLHGQLEAVYKEYGNLSADLRMYEFKLAPLRKREQELLNEINGLRQQIALAKQSKSQEGASDECNQRKATD